MTNATKRVLIIGGGFGGIAAAQKLETLRLTNVKITLICDKPHFEYHAALYRVVAGSSPLEVCIPLRDIFQHRTIECVIDTIKQVDLETKIAYGASESRYAFDYLILALGSVTDYYGISGLSQFSFGYKSITEALMLKNHIHEMFESAKLVKTKEEETSFLHFIIIGAGASGVELAGELALYSKKLALKHGIDKNLITIDLFEVAPRVLPALPPSVSAKVDRRLHRLGVNIFTQQKIIKEDLDQLTIEGNTVKTKTVIWTAGVKPNELYSNIKGLTLDHKGRVIIDKYLQAKGFEHIFVIGDGAATPYTGMAQTAIYDGKFVADIIARSLQGLSLYPYKPKKTYSAIPVGARFAVAVMGDFAFYGYIGWFLRRIADLRYFLTILPFSKAITAWRSKGVLCESCEICGAKSQISKPQLKT